MTTNWENLAKNALDPQNIQQAIAENIDIHNDDPNAHLGADQALQSHRAAEIIDHLAESVVNDKIAAMARAYVAIVGSGLSGDFETIEAAVAFAASVGGGTILILSGDYYLSELVDLPLCVNLKGVDRETVRIHTSASPAAGFNFSTDLTNSQLNCHIESLQFFNSGGVVFTSQFSSERLLQRIFFNDVSFTGGGTYFDGYSNELVFSFCSFFLNSTVALSLAGNVLVDHCLTTSDTGSGVTTRFIGSVNYSDAPVISLFNSRFLCINSGDNYYFSDNGVSSLVIDSCEIYNMNTTGAGSVFSNVRNSYISLKAGSSVVYNASFVGGVFINNIIVGGATPNLILNGSNAKVLANRLNSQPSNTSPTNIVDMNSPEVSLAVVASTTTALNLAINRVAQYTPTAVRTLTTTVPPVGARRTIIFLTSGASSYTQTFGTGFKAVSSLATGTVSGRRFVLEFISDGTYLVESSRTASIA